MRAGDLFVFSGGNAHMAMSVSERLSLSAYESFVNLAPANLSAFLDSGTPAQYARCRARQPMLDDIKAELADNLDDLCAEYEADELRDERLERATPHAVQLLRADPLIRRAVPPLRPKRRRRS